MGLSVIVDVRPVLFDLILGDTNVDFSWIPIICVHRLKIWLQTYKRGSSSILVILVVRILKLWKLFGFLAVNTRLLFIDWNRVFRSFSNESFVAIN